jgi:hypothetical protein
LPPAGCRPAGVGVGGRDARFAPGPPALIAEPRFAPLVAPQGRTFDIVCLSCIDRQWLLDHLSVMQEVTTSGSKHADKASGLRIRVFASMTNQPLQMHETRSPRGAVRIYYVDLVVELRGFEPLTFCMPCRRATSCAIAPWCDDPRRSGTELAYWLPNSDTYRPGRLAR